MTTTTRPAGRSGSTEDPPSGPAPALARRPAVAALLAGDSPVAALPPTTSRGRGRGAGRPIWAWSAALAVLVLCLVPVAFIVSAAGAAGPDVIAQVAWRPRVLELLGNTVLLALVVVPASVALGLGAALLVERCRVPRWLAIGFVAPLSVPAFVASYAWATVWPSISGLSGAALVATLSYYPFVYLPVLGTLRRLDPDLEESAAALGLTPLQTYARAVLPQLRLPVLAGALLVTLHLLAEYGAFAFVRFDTFTTAIYDQYKSTFAGPAASVLAGVLVLLSLVVLGAEAAVRGRRRHVRLGGGTSRPPRRLALGRWTLPLILAVTALFAASLGVPAFALVRWLAVGTAWDDAVLAAVTTTLGYGAIGALVTCLAALPVVWLAVRHPSVWSRALESATFVCSSLPGIVVGLAFVTVSIRAVPGLYQSAGVLLGAYVLLFLPRALVSLRAGLAQAPPGLDEAAQSLGRTPMAAFLRITLRLTAPAAAAGAALVFLAIVNELTATLMLAPNGTRTLATEFWSKSSEIDYVGAAPAALLMIVLSAPMTYLLFRESRRAAGP